MNLVLSFEYYLVFWNPQYFLCDMLEYKAWQAMQQKLGLAKVSRSLPPWQVLYPPLPSSLSSLAAVT